MKHLLLAAALAATAAPAWPADVSASITIGQPGFYGRIDLGDFPEPPQVLYAEPVVIERVTVAPAPIYLRVPPGHAKHWSKHCAEYHACSRPVYFVRDEWYSDVYVPRYRNKHGDYGERHGHDDGRGEDHDEGHGHGHGKGHKDKD